MDDFTITTIYFDGQFWTALIEKSENERRYTGRYVFGAEPTNPQLLNWMMYTFADVPLFPESQSVHINIRKYAQKKSTASLCKSLDAFKTAQAEYFDQKKKERRKTVDEDKQLKWKAKQIKKKEKKRH